MIAKGFPDIVKSDIYGKFFVWLKKEFYTI